MLLDRRPTWRESDLIRSPYTYEYEMQRRADDAAKTMEVQQMTIAQQNMMLSQMSLVQ